MSNIVILLHSEAMNIFQDILVLVVHRVMICPKWLNL